MATSRAEAIFRDDLQRVALHTDRLFFWLLIGQWGLAVVIALVWSPRTWIAEYWSIHQHVVAAALLGALFGAFTSGSVLVYDATGRERFRGGITDRRGSDDDNPGLRRFVHVLDGGQPVAATPSPVFGCPLVASRDEGVS